MAPKIPHTAPTMVTVPCKHMAKSITRETGNRGELVAAQHLRSLGYDILEMNYRYGHGEIDIIANDGSVLVFCEVKTRYTDEYGDPLQAITLRKQQQLRRVAEGYLYEHEIRERECRFDVIAIRMKGKNPEILYLKNAF